jgi:hypothetical protein
MHPLVNTPFHKVFPTIGWCLKCFLCCTDNRKERLEELHKITEEEKKIHDMRLDEVLKE